MAKMIDQRCPMGGKQFPGSLAQVPALQLTVHSIALSELARTDRPHLPPAQQSSKACCTDAAAAAAITITITNRANCCCCCCGCREQRLFFQPTIRRLLRHTRSHAAAIHIEGQPERQPEHSCAPKQVKHPLPAQPCYEQGTEAKGQGCACI